MIGLSRSAIALSLAFAGVYACASTGGPSSEQAHGQPSTAGSAAAAGSLNGGTSTAGSGGLVNLNTTPAAPDAPQTPDAACGIGTAAATLRPLTLMIMFDRSGRMVHSGSVDPVTMLNKWQRATAALTSFFRDPKAAGLNVALRFFPDNYTVGRCTIDVCDVLACSQVAVDAGTLTADPAPQDKQEAALINAIATSEPTTVGALGGGAPISAALNGALLWATGYQTAHPEQKTVVVLVTQGDPLGCDEDFKDISALAADALAVDGVQTYAIGLADSMGVALMPYGLNQLAAAGGTNEALFVNDGPMSAAAVLADFSTIQGMALPCDFPVPAATDNDKPVDTTLVNVMFSSGDSAQTTFTKVDDANHCSASRSWYYNDEAAPSRVYLCPAACDLAKGDAQAKLQILVGCEPVLEVPR